MISGIGWIIARFKKLDEHSIGVLNKIGFNFLVPFLIFNNTMATDFYTDFNPRLIIVSALAIFALMIASWVLFGLTMKDRARRCIFIMGAFRTNYVIYAISIAITMFGQDNVKSAVLLVPVAILCFNFFGIIVLIYHSKKSENVAESIRRTAIDFCKNPQILAAVFGILFSLARIQLPQFLQGGVSLLAGTASPISLLLLGAQLDFKKLTGDIRQVLAICMMRLVIIPAIMIPIMIWLGFRGPDLAALLIMFGAPLAVNCLVMARNYNIDPPFAAQAVMLSTVLSIPSIFIFLTVLTGLGMF